MWEGKRRPELRCTATTASGKPCGHLSLVATRSFAKPVCSEHLSPRNRPAVDAFMRERALRNLRSTNVVTRRAAERTLALIQRRDQERMWKQDRYAPGSTLPAMSDRDIGRLDRWLARRGFSIDALLPETGRPPSPCLVNAWRWTAIRSLSGSITEERALEIVRKHLLREVRWLELQAARRG